MLPSVTGITLESLLPSTNRRLAHIVSGNNQIGFDLRVDNLKTGKVRKVRNTFPTCTTYGELDILQVSLAHFTRGASWKYLFTRGSTLCMQQTQHQQTEQCQT